MSNRTKKLRKARRSGYLDEPPGKLKKRQHELWDNEEDDIWNEY